MLTHPARGRQVALCAGLAVAEARADPAAELGFPGVAVLCHELRLPLASGAGTPQHGLSSDKMALITSDSGTTRSPGVKTALITSDAVRALQCWTASRRSPSWPTTPSSGPPPGGSSWPPQPATATR